MCLNRSLCYGDAVEVEGEHDADGETKDDGEDEDEDEEDARYVIRPYLIGTREIDRCFRQKKERKREERTDSGVCGQSDYNFIVS